MTTTATEFEARSTAFLSWFVAQSGTSFHPSLRLTDLRDRNAGRGILATANIPADTELFAIPRSSVLSVETSPLAQKLPELFISSQTDTTSQNESDELDDHPHEIPTPWIHLILILIYEYLHRDTSQWRVYLDLLPTEPSDFNTLMFWSPADLRTLHSSHILQKIGRDSADAIFRKQILPVVTHNSAIFYPSTATSHLSDEQILQMAHCMGSLIMSYAFELQPDDDDSDSSSDEGSGAIDGWKEDKPHQGTMGMVPMADLLNADAEFNAHLSHGDSILTMTSIRDIAAGEEILNYYGPLPNAELCRRYGYTSFKHAIYDVVEIPWIIAKNCILEEFGEEVILDKELWIQLLETVETENDLLGEAFVLERETEGPDDSGVCSKPSNFQSPPEDLVNLIVVDIFGKLPNKILKETEQKKRLLSIFLRMLKTRLAQYNTVAEGEDFAAKASGRSQMAIDIINGEKNLVQEAMAWTERKLQALTVHETGEPQSRDGPPRKKRKM